MNTDKTRFRFPRSRPALAASRVFPGDVEASDRGNRQPGGEGSLWLCCHLPRLSLEALGLPEQRPAAVVEVVRGRLHIHCASPAAESSGIEAGMAFGAALALCADLETHRRDPARELEALCILAEACLQFTPWVSLDYEGALLLEVRGSLKLFGGADALVSRVMETVRALGHECRIAVTPAPLASWLLAKRGEGGVVAGREALRSCLGALPVTALALEPRTAGRLAKAGISTLRDFWRLPREGLARRYGTSLLRLLDRAAGVTGDLPKQFHGPPRFEAALELPAEAETLSGYFPAVERLVAQLTQFLITRDAAVAELRLVLDHGGGAATEISLVLRSPARAAEHLLALLEEKLERSPLAAPVRALRLHGDSIEPWAAPTLDLFSRPGGQVDAGAGWPRLLEQLEARFGRRVLRRLEVAADHRPERAMVFSESIESTSRPAAGTFPLRAPRPLWLLPSPAATETGLHLLPGTERIESGWWDGSPLRRDYRWALDRHGVRWWVYRDPARPGRWLRHGLYG